MLREYENSTLFVEKCLYIHKCLTTPLAWFKYIDDVFFIWSHGPDKLVSFMTEFNNYHPNIKFTYESNKENITFLDLDVSLSGNKLTTDLHTSLQINISICIIHQHT